MNLQPRSKSFRVWKLITCFAAAVLFNFLFFLSFQKSPSAKRSRLVSTLQLEVAESLYRKEGLVLSGIGAETMDQIKKIRLYFWCDREATVEEARVLILKAVDQLLAVVNKSEEMRPFLKHYPFLVEDVGLSLSFCSQEGKLLPRGKLNRVEAYGGKIEYQTTGLDGKMEVIQEEDYREAKLL